GAESNQAVARLNETNRTSVRNICGALAIGISLVALPLIGIARLIGRRMRGIVDALRQEAARANQSSAQLADSSRALSDAASTTAASLKQTNASLSEIITSVRSSGDHSQYARQCSEKTVCQADVAAAEMAQMTTSMVEMKVASASISKIIHVIDEI